MKRLLLSFSTALTLSHFASAANIERSTITEVVKDASILQPAAKSRKAARVNEIFGVPDVLRTGADSRVEMVAEDQTVTRVGANTLFSFEPQKREINLQKGSVLFNSPTGKGGGTIRTAAATAAVQGTTLIVVTTKNGGFKVLLLEGHGSVKTAGGKSRSIAAGQMVYALPGGDLSGVLTFHLAEQVGVSRLVGGFRKPLPSKEKIDVAVTKQDAQIAKGQLVTTGLLASDSPTQAYKVDNTIALDVMESPEKVQRITSSAQAGIIDATIATPKLDADRIFSAAKGIPLIFGPGTNVGADLPPDFSLFIARNTTVLTNTIDLSPYPGEFVFFSTGDFIVDRNLLLAGGGRSVAIVAGGALRQRPGAIIRIDAQEAFVSLGFSAATSGSGTSAGDPLMLVGGGIQSSGNLSIFASDIDLNHSMFFAQNDTVLADATGDFNAVGFGANAPQFAAPNAVILAAGNNLNVSNSVTSAPHASFFAENDMTLTNVAFLTSGGPAQSVRLNATNLMTLTNTAFRSQDVALGARTLALTNVAFLGGSKVRLRSETGLLAARPNTNQPVELGKVNFIRNVTHGSVPAQVAVSGGSITITK